MDCPILSICIPTYGREKILYNTLQSIYSQNIDFNLFEVCISDNSPTDETKDMLKEYFPNIPNIIYKKSNCEGYFNSIEALKMGKGKFLKLHNNYTKIKENTLTTIINNISSNEDSVIFFCSGNMKLDKNYLVFNSFDDFLNTISHYSTWSSAFGIWKSDFDHLMKQQIEINKMFPHTSLLFNLYKKDKYIVDNNIYFDNQDVGKKGGYNLPETFGSEYLTMCKTLLDQNIIASTTYETIKKNILLFIAEWYANITYLPEKYTFSFENWESIINNLYGNEGVVYIKKYLHKQHLKYFIRKILHKQ